MPLEWLAALALLVPSESSLARDYNDMPVPYAPTEIVPDFDDVEARLREAHEKFTPGPRLRCGDEIPTGQLLDEYLGDTKHSISEYWSRSSCRELFSTEPPEWLTGYSSMKNNSALKPEWMPLCGLTLMSYLRRRAAGASVEALFNDYRKELRILDKCQAGDFAKKAAIMEQGAPSTGSAPKKHRLLSPSKRALVMSAAEEVRDNMVGVCCPPRSYRQSECIARMKALPIGWCDPGKPGDCPKSGAAHLWSCQYFKMGGISAILGTTAKIALSPEVDDEGLWTGRSMQVFAHELAHGCSFIRQTLVANADQEHSGEMVRRSKLTDAAGNPGEGCPITEMAMKTYRELFRGLGGNKEVFECMVGVARRSASRRWDPNACDACPSQQLEEGFAMWMSLITDPEKFVGPMDAWDVCSSQRDATHPLFMDVLKCALKSARARKMLKIATGCLGTF